MQDDYYTLLGVSDSATQSEIKKGYRDKARLLHPDKNQAPNAKEVFQKIKQAYDTLSDPVEKRKYDLTRPVRRNVPISMSFNSRPFGQAGPSANCFAYQHKPTGVMRKNAGWTESDAMAQGGEYYRKYLARMRQQREEQMRRRREAQMNHEEHVWHSTLHRAASAKCARLNLEWDANCVISLDKLKDKCKVTRIFSQIMGSNRRCIAEFRNAKAAQEAADFIEKNYPNIIYEWMTPKPKINKEPILLEDSDDSDCEIVEEDDDDCVITDSQPGIHLGHGFPRHRFRASPVEIISDSDDDSDLIDVDENIIINDSDGDMSTSDIVLSSDEEDEMEDDMRDRSASLSPRNASQNASGEAIVID